MPIPKVMRIIVKIWAGMFGYGYYFTISDDSKRYHRHIQAVHVLWFAAEKNIIAAAARKNHEKYREKNQIKPLFHIHPLIVSG